ncbi:hypothetical protein [Sphaerimonospora thailandensis]|uniref:hypothetical protein n=1 Tax=Sphaerimonospora thailandensis TaxID=795644 RepID=UPI00195268AD|nr:hypothetical protein [Sphaerimonospora thailandensis]
MTYCRKWRAWGPDSGEAEDRIISELLESPGSANKVWLADTPEGLLDNVTWHTGADALRELEKGNKEVDRARRDIEAGYLAAADHLPWCHVLIHPDHEVGEFRKPESGRKPWILLDIQFRNRWSSRIMVIGVSFWAGDPAWAPEKAGRWLPPKDGDRARHEWFVDYERQAREYVEGHFQKVNQDLQEEYAAPEFWIAMEGDVVRKQVVRKQVVRKQRAQPTHDAVGEQELRSARDLYETMHGTVSPRDVDERPRLFRKVGRRPGMRWRLFADDLDLALSSADVCVVPIRRGDRKVRECYVVLPKTPHLNGTVVGEQFRSAVVGLLSLETLVASGNDISNDLEVWREHAMIYQHAARTMSALWDGVASHLPIRRWLRLNRAHRAVELIHLTLLQGMADLADVASHLDERVRRIERLEHLADDQFAATLGWAGRGLREALDDASRFTTVKRRGTQARYVVDRATEQYKNLLEAMAHAFDERRVRELEVLQRAGFWLSVAVGGFGVLTFMDFFMSVDKWPVSTFFMEPTGEKNGEPVSTGLKPGTWAILALLFLGMVGSWAYSVWLRRMGSIWFHRTFRKLERYLRLSSTRELELMRAGITAPSPKQRRKRYRRLSSTQGVNQMRLEATPLPPEEWTKRDEDLAGRFAELWDAATLHAERGSSCRPPVPDRADGDRRKPVWPRATRAALRGQWWTISDLAMQRNDIEALTVRTLLLAERTPTLRRYGLPRLALLHRHCGRLPVNWFGDFDGVPKTELKMVFAAAGLPAGKAEEVDKSLTKRIADTKALIAGRMGEREKVEAGKKEIMTAQDLLVAINEELEDRRSS